MDDNINNDVRDCIGESAYLALINSFGGKKIYVPANLGPHHPLSQVIGLDAAQKLSSEFQGVHLNLPASTRKQAHILADLERGKSVSLVAATYWVTPRYVRLLKAQHKPKKTASSQGQLF